MWSRFRSFRWQSVCSNSKLFTHSSVIGVGVSVAHWVQSNEEDFNVPTWNELQQTNDRHLKRDDNNDRFFNIDYENMITEYTAKLENESEREILAFYTQIIEGISGAKGLENKIVVDIGVGTGVFIKPMLQAIGDDGCYIGLDISPAFIYHTNEQYKSQHNVKVNLSQDDDLKLPSELQGEVDVFFICATYHHFSDVNAMLNQIYEYLKPGGKLVIIEYKKHHHHGHDDTHHKHDGNDHAKALDQAMAAEKGSVISNKRIHKEWIKKHISFTEQQAKAQIMAKAFVFDHDILKGTLNDHFIHVYRKPSFN
eukprot:352928_1